MSFSKVFIHSNIFFRRPAFEMGLRLGLLVIGVGAFSLEESVLQHRVGQVRQFAWDWIVILTLRQLISMQLALFGQDTLV
jgi:hypothetical protein